MIPTGWPVTVGVVKVGVVDTRLAAVTLTARGARVYAAHRGWLGVVTGISEASTGGVLVTYTHINTVTTVLSSPSLFH